MSVITSSRSRFPWDLFLYFNKFLLCLISLIYTANSTSCVNLKTCESCLEHSHIAQSCYWRSKAETCLSSTEFWWLKSKFTLLLLTPVRNFREDLTALCYSETWCVTESRSKPSKVWTKFSTLGPC